MYYIDPHIHMISRITDDYQRMAQCGCVALSEPAFWAGFDRGSAEGFRDYSRHLTEVEPRRPVRHPPLLLAVHQRQGSREPAYRAGSSRAPTGAQTPPASTTTAAPAGRS